MMKKGKVGAVLLTAAAVGVLTCSGARAATYVSGGGTGTYVAGGGMKYGGLFSLNFASIAGPDNEGLDEVLFGVGLGGVVDIPVSGDLVMETGLIYMMKGGQGSVDMGVVVDSSVTLQYLEVPLLAKYILAGGGGYVSGGLTLDLLLKAEMKGEAMGVSVTDDITDDTTALDICAAFGGGGSFTTGAGKLNVGGQLSFGLVTLDDVGDAEVFTQTISVILNYTF